MSDVLNVSTSSSSSPAHATEASATTDDAGKFDRAQKSISDKKEKRYRTISDEQKAEYVSLLIQDQKDGCFSDGEISLAVYVKKFNVIPTIFKDIYIKALSKGMELCVLNEDVKKATSDNTCFINKRGMCLIGKHFFDDFNKKSSQDQMFTLGQKFTPSVEGNRIILTPVD